MKAPRFTLRLKLALVSLLLLAVPLIGLWYAVSLRVFLLDAQQEALASTARSIAAILDDRPQLLFEPAVVQAAKAATIDTYPLQRTIRLDGNLADWGDLLQKATAYGEQNILEQHDFYDPQSLSFKFLSGRYEDSLYLLFLVKDDRVVYREKHSLRIDRSDHLEIALENEGGLLDRYAVAPARPGPVNASLVLGSPGKYRATVTERRIQGVWQETKDGYLVEMCMPLNLLTGRVSFAVADVDDPASRDLEMVIGTGGVDRVEDLGVLLAKNPELEGILKALQPQASRIWVVDQKERVRGEAGSLETVQEQGDAFAAGNGRHASYLLRLVRLLTPYFRGPEKAASAQPATGEFTFDRLQQVLVGKAFLSRRSAGDGGLQIVAAAQPLWSGKKILGAVVVEQPTDAVLSGGSRVIERLVLASAAVFLLGAGLLLLLATRLAGRVRRLRTQTNGAIARDGRVVGPFDPAADSDELGDLSRHLAVAISRLQDYQRHQEKMADNLEHEMRTPLAGVSASLANLGRQLGPDHPAVREYLFDARKNLQRLEAILTGIREAATIKDGLRRDDQEKFDLCAALRSWTESYRKTFTKVRFSLQAPEESIHILADPDRIFQMMDKLVENAVDFSPPGATVEIHLGREAENAVIEVLNEGPRLDEGRADQLFHSMVSERSRSKDEKTHMGLGLFIVRSIVEFHGGQWKARNRADGTAGAAFEVRLPVHSWIRDISIEK